MTAISKAITSAMAVQLDRVNMSDNHLLEKVQTYEEANAYLRQRVKAMQARINELELEVNDLYRKMREGAPSEHLYHNNRPVLTAHEVAVQTGIKLHTVYRYLRSGHWASDQIGGQYVIYADQPLVKPKPKKRGPKNRGTLAK